MTNITGIFGNIQNFFAVDMFGTYLLFALFLIGLLIILLFLMGAGRYVVIAFIIPLLTVLTTGSGWISKTWIGTLGFIFGGILLYFMYKRIFSD